MREGFQEKASEPSLKVLINNACGQDPWMTNPCGHARSVRVTQGSVRFLGSVGKVSSCQG